MVASMQLGNDAMLADVAAAINEWMKAAKSYGVPVGKSHSNSPPGTGLGGRVARRAAAFAGPRSHELLGHLSSLLLPCTGCRDAATQLTQHCCPRTLRTLAPEHSWQIPPEGTMAHILPMISAQRQYHSPSFSD